MKEEVRNGEEGGQEGELKEVSRKREGGEEG